MQTNFNFPVVLQAFSGTVIANFPDIPEAITEGGSREEALENAVDCLDVALLHLVDGGHPIPIPSGEGDAFVYPSAEIVAKLMVIQAWKEAGITKLELARRLEVQQAEARRILDPRHNTKLSTLNRAAKALGGHLEVTFAAH